MKHKRIILRAMIIGAVFLSILGCLLTKPAPEKPEDWITLTAANEGQTGTSICQKAGYSVAVSARRCDGTIYTFPDTFTHVNCKAGANRYQDCFDFYACSHKEDAVKKGVIFEAIYCKK